MNSTYVLNFCASRHNGTRNYTTGIVSALLKEQHDHKMIIILPNDIMQKFENAQHPNIKFYTHSMFGNSAFRIFWEQLVLPVMLLFWNAKVLFSPYDIASFLSPCPVVLASRNPSPLHMAMGWISNSRLLILKAHIQKFIAKQSTVKAAVVFFPTYYAAKVLGGLFQIPAHKIRVVNHGVEHSLWNADIEPTQTLSRFGLHKGKYFLFVSNFYHYKNPHQIIDAFYKNANLMEKLGYKVILVGGEYDTGYVALIKGQIRNLNLTKSILFAGQTNLSDLQVFYKNAKALVMPTQLETFCQPFVEAMAAGIPVIAADLPFAREVCAGGAIYVELGNIDQLADVLKNAAEDDTYLELYATQASVEAKRFSWKIEADQTIGLLKEFAKQ